MAPFKNESSLTYELDTNIILSAIYLQPVRSYILGDRITSVQSIKALWEENFCMIY
jgi:hypothetical protein